MNIRTSLAALFLALAAAAPHPDTTASTPAAPAASAPAAESQSAPKDAHSYANTHEAWVTHVDLDWTADFARKVLTGSATLSVGRPTGAGAGPLVLDTRALNVTRAET